MKECSRTNTFLVRFDYLEVNFVMPGIRRKAIDLLGVVVIVYLIGIMHAACVVVGKYPSPRLSRYFGLVGREMWRPLLTEWIRIGTWPVLSWRNVMPFNIASIAGILSEDSACEVVICACCGGPT